MLLSREIYIKLYQNVYILSFKQIILSKYATNMKKTISQRSLRNSSLLLSLFEFNNFSFLIDIMDNIIYASGTCHQNSNQWQCIIIVTCLRLYHVTSILHCHLREFWSRDTDVYLTYIRFGIILTQFNVIFSRQRHQIELLYVSCFSLYPLSFFIYSPF